MVIDRSNSVPVYGFPVGTKRAMLQIGGHK